MATNTKDLRQRPLVSAAGVACLVVGVPLLILPGPGILLIAAGFALLGARYHWARRAGRKLRDGLRRRGL